MPRGARRWWPDERKGRVSHKVRQQVLSVVQRQPPRNDFSSWQMNYPLELPDGSSCPISALGECGDPKCPTYRPKHPEVREAVEKFVVEKCKEYFVKGVPLDTYASVGCGLLGQDWALLEQLRKVGLKPCRAIFIELRTALPVMTCEGSQFPRATPGGGMNLRQTGFIGPLGPEFSFSATVQFAHPEHPSMLFDFSNGAGEDRLFVEVGGPDQLGTLTFGCMVAGQVVPLEISQCWEPGQDAHSYLFTISATGTMKVYLDGELIAALQGRAPRSAPRRQLFVGQSSHEEGKMFHGTIQKIKVWDQEVDHFATNLMYVSEVDSAVGQFAQWYSGEMAVWTFGSLASYAAAVEKDKRFAADLLMKVDVHDELDGYDDFICQALGPNGLALTLGGPGKSWCRRGGGWCPVDATLPILDKAEARSKLPWAFMGAFPGDEDRGFQTKAVPSQQLRAGSRRRPGQRRCTEPRSRRCRAGGTDGRRNSALLAVEVAQAKAPPLATQECSLDDLLAELQEVSGGSLLADLDALEEEDEEELPGLQILKQPARRPAPGGQPARLFQSR